MPSLGPAYSTPWVFAKLPDTWVSGLVDQMMDDRRAVLIDPFATQSVQTIAAFPSLHVAIAMTACLMAHLLGLPRFVRVAAWVFLGLTEISTIYFGWHFFVDTIAGAAVGAAAVYISAYGTGNLSRGWPRLGADEVTDDDLTDSHARDERIRSA